MCIRDSFKRVPLSAVSCAPFPRGWPPRTPPKEARSAPCAASTLQPRRTVSIYCRHMKSGNG
eukprot:7361114-Alexandrium_andersonii.AAC.1